MQQMMASLPEERLAASTPAFTNVGVDFFGPWLVTQRRTRIKRYGCIFTCMTSRAVHLEVTHTLNTDSFLCAITRFMSRRGTPEKIYSDNGTNLVRGNKELANNISAFNKQQINDWMLQRDINWSFRPPGASHMGGVWERLIRSVRTILAAMLKQQIVSDEVLQTLFAEAERIINSRPITSVSDDAKDPEPITPSHLLLLKPNGCLPPGVFIKADMHVSRWRQMHYMANLFWRRWTRDYLPSLQMREKWQRPHVNVKPQDLVLLVDSNMPRGRWPLGVVVEVNKSRSDNLVRSCKIRVGNSLFTRPIHKICLLEQSQL